MSSARAPLRAFGTWLLLLAAGGALVLALKPTGFIQAKDLGSYFAAASLLLTLCFVLARPSVLGFSGWSPLDLASAKERCPVLMDLSDAEIPAVQFFVGHAASSIQRRVVTLWWIAGSIWAATAFLVQKGIEASDGNMVGAAVLLLLAALMSAGLIALYTRSTNQVHGLAYALLIDRQADLRRIQAQGALRKQRVKRGLGRRNRTN
jgi:hypothetical protein